MEFFGKLRKRRAIKLYIRKLPRLLVRDYGKSRTYRPKQVRSTIERSGLPIIYTCYAIVIFCSKDDFNEYHEELGEACDYESMRSEVGHLCFYGNTNFSSSDAVSEGSDSSGVLSGSDGGSGD